MEELNQLNQDIARNIRVLRVSRGLTQEGITGGMGVHRSLYTRLEKGTAKTSITTIIKAADFFNVSVDKIVFGKDTKQSNKKTHSKNRTIADKLKELDDLNPDDKKIALKIIDLALSKKKLKDLLQKIDSSDQ